MTTKEIFEGQRFAILAIFSCLSLFFLGFAWVFLGFLNCSSYFLSCFFRFCVIHILAKTMLSPLIVWCGGRSALNWMKRDHTSRRHNLFKISVRFLWAWQLRHFNAGVCHISAKTMHNMYITHQTGTLGLSKKHCWTLCLLPSLRSSTYSCFRLPLHELHHESESAHPVSSLRHQLQQQCRGCLAQSHRGTQEEGGDSGAASTGKLDRVQCF